MGFHKMPWLWKHPKTGIYWFRRATPRDLMAARGQLEAFGIKVPREALKTLGVRDPDEAEGLACAENERCVARWNSWRTLLADGPRVLSQKEVFALSAQIARRLAERFGENPGDPERRQLMQRHLADISDNPRPEEAAYLAAVLRAILPKLGVAALAPASMTELTKQFAKDAPLMAGNLAAMAEGDYSEPGWLTKRPKIEQPSSASQVTFERLLEDWKKESDPKDSSVEAYEKRIRSFSKFLGHDVASRVTRDDAQRWKLEMLAVAEPNAKSINLKLDAVHTLFAIAINNGVIKGENPVKGLRLKGKRRKKAKARRDFTDAEAQAILRAARGMEGFLRWAPWLMAYSGARVGEIAQLRRGDVTGKRDEWAFAITDEAGTVKTEAGERIIPLHAALVREGFPGFAKSTGTARLFPELYRNDAADNTPRKVSRRGQDAMRRWIRGKLGIVDLKIGPDHSWRHWFHTMCRRYGVNEEIRRVLVGHAPVDVGGRYGDLNRLLGAMRRELEKIEALDLEGYDPTQSDQ